MIPIQAALLVCPLLPTIAAQAPGLRDLEDPRAWRLFDRVEVIVNEEIVTVSQFDRDFREFVRATGMTATTPRETQEVSILVAQRKVDGLLTEQGGRDLGFDEAQVRRMVSNWEDSLIEEAGGVGQRSEALLDAGSAAHLERAQLTDDIYRISWERAITGRDAGPLGRPTKDRYVRPGQLRHLYDQAAAIPGGLEQLGAGSGNYRLQLLILDVDAVGGIDKTLARAEEVQRRLAEGADFNDLVEEFSAAKGQASFPRPMTSTDLETIAKREDAWGELARWTLEAEAGRHSGNIYVDDRGNESVQIAHLIERPIALPFHDAHTQAAMRAHTLEVRDGYHRSRALEDLKRAAYIWTPDYEPQPQPEVVGPPLPIGN
ncbi:MAG: hypothetical protein H6831_01930 [Planctomycetes bacterium]|nr:hypothetical protein [Planctomycetota bacterium]MCB9903145.1 hypothetical protein [Planctomycetota bacterium]